MDLTKDRKEIGFVWVASHLGITGDLAADSTAKDALKGNILDELIPFSDLKFSVNKYLSKLWQLDWDKFLENKLHKIFPHLKDCNIWTNRK